MSKQDIKRGLLAAGAFLALGATAIQGQGVEAIMRERERLELTEQQVQQLDAIRQEAVAERTAERARIAELRSQLEAGQIRRSELMAAMEEQQDARQARAEERRASIDAILTEAQRESLQEVRRRADRQRPGVARGGRGSGPRARPGSGSPRRPRPGGGAGIGLR
jgi:Spy/CpxP family protein refolding chaperone